MRIACVANVDVSTVAVARCLRLFGGGFGGAGGAGGEDDGGGGGGAAALLPPGGLSFVAMSAAALSYAAGSFDVVLDKGCLDAVACAPSGAAEAVRGCLAECGRVLRPGGLFLLVTSLEVSLSTRSLTPELLAAAGFGRAEVERTALSLQEEEQATGKERKMKKKKKKQKKKKHVLLVLRKEGAVRC